MLVLTFTILLFGVLVLLLADRWRHSRGRERAPRCMGSIVFEKNERHAAWERSWPAPRATRPPQDQDKTKTRPPIEKVEFLHQKCWFFRGKV